MHSLDVCTPVKTEAISTCTSTDSLEIRRAATTATAATAALLVFYQVFAPERLVKPWPVCEAPWKESGREKNQLNCPVTHCKNLSAYKSKEGNSRSRHVMWKLKDVCCCERHRDRIISKYRHKNPVKTNNTRIKICPHWTWRSSSCSQDFTQATVILISHIFKDSESLYKCYLQLKFSCETSRTLTARKRN